MDPLAPLSIPDMLIVVISVLVCLGVGLYYAPRVRTGEDHLTAARRVPASTLALSLFATLASGVLLCGGLGHFESAGLGSLRALFLVCAWVPLLAWVFVPVLQRSRLITVPHYLGQRFSPAVQRLGGLWSLLLLLGLLALELVILGGVLRALTGLPALGWAATGALVVVLYTAWGGQVSSVATDVVQAVILLIGLAVLTILGLGATDLTELWQGLPLTLRSPVPEALGGKPLQGVAGLVTDGLLVSLALLLASQALVGRLVCARGERHGKNGVLWALGPLALVLAASLVIGGLALAWLGDSARIPASEAPVARMASLFTALSSPGLLGVLVAMLVVTVLSTCDSLLMGVAAVVAVDLLPHSAAEAGAQSAGRLRIARQSVLVGALIAVGLAWLLDGLGSPVHTGALLLCALGGPLAVVVLGGLLVDRLGGGSALLVLILGPVAGLVSLVFMAGPGVSSTDVLRAGLAALAASVLVLVAGRLVRPAPPRDQPDLTFGQLRPSWKDVQQHLQVAVTRSELGERDGLPVVKLSRAAREALEVDGGDQVHVTAGRAWLGLGLRSFRGVVAKPAATGEQLVVERDVAQAVRMKEGEEVVVERVG